MPRLTCSECAYFRSRFNECTHMPPVLVSMGVVPAHGSLIREVSPKWSWPEVHGVCQACGQFRTDIRAVEGVTDAAADRCRDCCSYSPGCESEYDGICKHQGIPATTELGRPYQIWRHVYKHDSCEAFNEERTRHKAEAAGGEK